MAWTTIGKLVAAINRWLAEQQAGVAGAEERTGFPHDSTDPTSPNAPARQRFSGPLADRGN